jgi:hypothetical protein
MSFTTRISAKRAMVFLGVPIMLTLAAGVASAAWTANGVGTAAAKAGTSSNLIAVVPANIGTTGSQSLVPSTNGATTPTVPVVVNVHNPNSFPVTVSTVVIAANVAPASNSGGISTCSATGVTLFAGTYNVTAGTAVVGAGADGQVLTSTNAIGMTPSSDNGCQSATFVFPAGGVTVNATS